MTSLQDTLFDAATRIDSETAAGRSIGRGALMLLADFAHRATDPYDPALARLCHAIVENSLLRWAGVEPPARAAPELPAPAARIAPTQLELF